MNTKLSDIAEVRSGVFAKTQDTGEILYLQAKHFDDLGRLTDSARADLESSATIVKHLLKPRDIVFSAKGSRTFAAVFANSRIPTVASTNFFVVRLNVESVLPEFLAWLLNGPTVQQFLRRNATNSTVVSISKSLLESVEVKIPSIEKQHIILHVSRLEQKEREIKQQIAELRRLQIQQIIDNAIK